jgi:hypothetical protein
MTKTRRYIAIGFNIIVVLILAGGGVAELVRAQPIIDSFTKLGVSEYAQTLGFFKLIFIVLYLIPRTMRIGFFLLCCYFGGAIATHLSHHDEFIQPAVPLVLIWVAAFLRDQALFFSKASQFIDQP